MKGGEDKDQEDEDEDEDRAEGFLWNIRHVHRRRDGALPGIPHQHIRLPLSRPQPCNARNTRRPPRQHENEL